MILGKSPLLLLLFSLLLVVVFAAPKSKWDSMDWNKIEKDYEKGDDPELLLSEDFYLAQEMDRRKGTLARPKGVKLKDETEWLKHNDAMSGPAMIFATLKDVDPDGKEWTSLSVATLLQRWQGILMTDGIKVNTYDLASQHSIRTKPQRVLISTQTGWRSYDIRDFLLSQEDYIVELEWDSVKYTPADRERLRDEEDARKSKAKRSKKPVKSGKPVQKERSEL